MITVFFDETAIDRPWRLSDDALAHETAATVERILPELAGALEMTHVSRWPEGLTNRATGDYHSTAGQNSAVAWGNNTARGLIDAFR